MQQAFIYVFIVSVFVGFLHSFLSLSCFVFVLSIYLAMFSGWLGSVAVECWTCNREVAGSTPGRRIVE